MISPRAFIVGLAVLMKRTVAAVLLAVSALTLGACGGEAPAPSAPASSAVPSPEQVRAQLCYGFAILTPGTLELSEAISVLADTGSSQYQRVEALKKANANSGSSVQRRTDPYDCNSPSDQARFERYVQKSEGP